MDPADPSSPVTPDELAGGNPDPRTGALADGKKTSWLAVIALTAIAVGFWYYYAYYGSVSPDLGGTAAAVTRRTESPKDEATTMLQQQSSSDAVSDIESDLKATDLDGLDRELSDIDAGL